MDPEVNTSKLQGNIWKYALLLIANKRIFVAILSAYYLTIPDVTAKSIGLILLVGNFAGFVFEIPSGYISDKIGHKQALVISRLLVLLSTTCFLVADDLAILIFAAISLSIGNAFHSGTGSAFMHETLRGLGREGDYAKVSGKISSIGFAVPIVFTVAVPFLVSISFKLPFLVALLVDLVGLFAALALVAPPVSQEEIKEIGVTNFPGVIREGLRLNFFPFAILAGVINGFLFSISGFRAPYQLFIGVPIVWFGVFFGLGRALASLMLAYTGKIKDYTNIYSFNKFKIVLYAILIFALGSVTDPWIIVSIFIIINAFEWGLSKVNNSYLLDIIRTSKFKATLLSTEAQIQNIMAALIGFGLGYAIEQISYKYAFVILGATFLLVTIPLMFYILKKRDKGAYAGLLSEA